MKLFNVIFCVVEGISSRRKPALYECNRLGAKCSDKISSPCNTGSLWIINEVDDSEVGASNEGSRCDVHKWICDDDNLDSDEECSGDKPCTRICQTAEAHFTPVSMDISQGHCSASPADGNRKCSSLSIKRSGQIEAFRCSGLQDYSDAGSIANVASNVDTCGLLVGRLENCEWIHDPIDASEAGSIDNFARISTTSYVHKHLPVSAPSIVTVSYETLNCIGQLDAMKELKANIEAESVFNPPDSVVSVKSKVNSSYFKRKQVVGKETKPCVETEDVLNPPDGADSVISKVNSSYSRRKQVAANKEKGYIEAEDILKPSDGAASVISKVTSSSVREPRRTMKEEKPVVKREHLVGLLDGAESAPPEVTYKNSSDALLKERITRIVDISVEDTVINAESAKREAARENTSLLESSEVDASKGDQSQSKQSHNSKYAARGLKEEDESNGELQEMNDPPVFKGINDRLELTEEDMKTLQVHQKSSTMTTITSAELGLSQEIPFQGDGSADMVDTLSISLMSPSSPPEGSSRPFTTITTETSETPLSQVDQQKYGELLQQKAKSPPVLVGFTEFDDPYDNVFSISYSSQDNTKYFQGSVTSASVGLLETDFSKQNLRSKPRDIPSPSAAVSRPAAGAKAPLTADNSLVSEIRQPSSVDSDKLKDSGPEHNSRHLADSSAARNLPQGNENKPSAELPAVFNSNTYLPHSKRENNPSDMMYKMSLNRSPQVETTKTVEDRTDAQQIGSFHTVSSSWGSSPKNQLLPTEFEDLHDSTSSWGSIRNPQEFNTGRKISKNSSKRYGLSSIYTPSTRQENNSLNTSQAETTKAAELPIVTDAQMIGSVDGVSSSWGSPKKQSTTEFDVLRDSATSWGSIGKLNSKGFKASPKTSKNSSRGSGRYESFAIGVSQRNISSNIGPTVSDAAVKDRTGHLRHQEQKVRRLGSAASNRETKLSEKNGEENLPKTHLPVDTKLPLDRFMVNVKSQLSSEVEDGHDGRSEGFCDIQMRNKDEAAQVRSGGGSGENPGTQRHLSDVLLPTNKRLPLERFLGDFEGGGTSREFSSAATSGTVVTDVGVASGMYDAKDKSKNN